MNAATAGTGFDGLIIAAIVPCYNEEVAVPQVVTDLLAAVDDITVYVYDNNSNDRTAEVAAAAGAIVRTETRKGKGNVVRRAFADIDADIYLLIDGDDTYDASAAPLMIETLLSGPYDHVLGVRTEESDESAYRPGHEAGNRMFNRLISHLFGEDVTDMLSGYRVFSRRFVKSFPALSREFEIETELTVHAVNLRLPQVEVPVGFKDRPEGSESKLRTYHDGFRILRLIGSLLQHERPLALFSTIGAFFMVVAVILGIPLFFTYAETHAVPRLPTAVLATGVMLAGIMSFVVGLVLNGIQRQRRESARLSYLRLPSVARPDRPTNS
ncbi:glycosyltransferase [Rudaeicoccus suwonensis]|uniref:Glycosyltransferase involved in cell wall biosynthesis n=1 Tax=Rudaeicoccus suwonensis TaxID=657409 RepID=A0A561DVA2_9MICO|nr:glycosyltransferase [Rudaeicoccus suwonensis]TWE07282.1 glycosyltransferase involved in cell wall biosynthesis [Rudaeicoccus suwonensis]